MIDPGTVEFKKNARAKRVRITVRRNGTVLVTAPKRVPLSLVRNFFREKSAWVEDRLAYFRAQAGSSIAIPGKSNSRKEYLVYKEAARRLVHHRLAHFGALYGFSYGNVAVRNQKTRWGSCSKNRNLNFNYKIVHLQPEQQDYIIVHELCHLAEFNHSRAFWNLVSKQVPEYKNIRKSIRKFDL
jgi:predicted metal-dependent hydrolase